MELLLNFLWLLLLLPAYWLSQRGSSASPLAGGFQSRRGLIVLGCAVLLLFPVVSATDDIHAIRRDMEESSSGKSSVSGGSRHRGRPSVPAQPLAQSSPDTQFPAGRHVCGLVVADATRLGKTVLLTIRAVRAPPFLG
ncbi:MAG TPA: hypothetical protein VMT28_08135 [Terriglobales bacterium]|jgi:hypothetical protein|nr:hypothetical protein [Terriglobales bacterium]